MAAGVGTGHLHLDEQVAGELTVLDTGHVGRPQRWEDGQAHGSSSSTVTARVGVESAPASALIRLVA